jgi:hypothetical protein
MKIDKGVPIPDKVKASTSKMIEEIKNLEINDSFIVSNPNNLPIPKLRNQTNSKMQYYGKQLNYKFTIRNTDEGLRVWRVK